MNSIAWLHGWHPPAEVAKECSRFLEARGKKVLFSFPAQAWQTIETAAEAARILEQCFPADPIDMAMPPAGGKGFLWRREDEKIRKAQVIKLDNTSPDQMDKEIQSHPPGYDLFLLAHGAMPSNACRHDLFPEKVGELWLVEGEKVTSLR